MMDKLPVSPPIKKISLDELRWLRMQAQCLFPRRSKAELLQVIQSQIGVNAQLTSAMDLSLRARVARITKEDIDDLRTRQRLAVRTWCMRGTLHLLAAQDVAWLLFTLPAGLVAGGWRWLERRAGLPLVKAQEIVDAAWEILKANGPLTRGELVEKLTPRFGSTARAAAAGIVHLNGLLGRVCFGPDRGADPTYTVTEDWLNLPRVQFGTADYPELARRFLNGYGPAVSQDFAAWWGGALSQMKKVWDQLSEEWVQLDLNGQNLWMATEPDVMPGSPDPVVRLLPAFDNYYLGYRQRDFAVPAEHQPRVFHGGEIAPVILQDGRVAGTWHYETHGRQMRIVARPFTSFSDQVSELIAAEASDIGRFFHLEPMLSFKED